jgi:hypothetical protein
LKLHAAQAWHSHVEDQAGWTLRPRAFEKIARRSEGLDVQPSRAKNACSGDGRGGGAGLFDELAPGLFLAREV